MYVHMDEFVSCMSLANLLEWVYTLVFHSTRAMVWLIFRSRGFRAVTFQALQLVLAASYYSHWFQSHTLLRRRALSHCCSSLIYGPRGGRFLYSGWVTDTGDFAETRIKSVVVVVVVVVDKNRSSRERRVYSCAIKLNLWSVFTT